MAAPATKQGQGVLEFDFVQFAAAASEGEVASVAVPEALQEGLVEQMEADETGRSLRQWLQWQELATITQQHVMSIAQCCTVGPCRVEAVIALWSLVTSCGLRHALFHLCNADEQKQLMIRLGPLALINLLGPEGAYWFDLCRPDARAALKKLLSLPFCQLKSNSKADEKVEKTHLYDHVMLDEEPLDEKQVQQLQQNTPEEGEVEVVCSVVPPVEVPDDSDQDETASDVN